jgi:hypothetical protein
MATLILACSMATLDRTLFHPVALFMPIRFLLPAKDEETPNGDAA